MGLGTLIEHIPIMVSAPRRCPRTDQELVLKVRKDLGLLENGSLAIAVHGLGHCQIFQAHQAARYTHQALNRLVGILALRRWVGS